VPSRWLLPFALALAACAGSTPDGAPSDPARAPMTAELFPFVEQVVTVRVGREQQGVIRMTPAGESRVDLAFRGRGVRERNIEVRSDGSSLFFRTGPDRGTELVRFAARPGDAWESAGGTVRFIGWERIEVPAGTYDAARVLWSTGDEGFARADTWWFAPGVGLVRLASRWGDLFEEELVRVTP